MKPTFGSTWQESPPTCVHDCGAWAAAAFAEARKIVDNKIEGPAWTIFVLLGETHPRRSLQIYACYCNKIRTHRSLDKGAPVSRPVQPTGSIKSHPVLGGLHHHYVRV